MNNYSELLNAKAAEAEARSPRNTEDFYKDGILICGKCGAPKQTRESIPVIGRPYSIPCDCEKAARAEEEKKRQAIRIERLRNYCFDNAKMKKQTFTADDGRNQHISTICRNYAANFEETNGKGLVLFGDPGTGKSFFACCVANALIDKGIPCRCTSFIEQSKSGDDLTGYRFIVLDDFGAERDTSFMREVVYSTVDTLYRSGTPFILTTNMSAADLNRGADVDLQRVLSRLHEVCLFHEVKGKDRRRETLRRDTEKYRAILDGVEGV